MDKVVTIQEIVGDPSGVAAVDIYFWLINKTTGETRYQSSLQMSFVPAGRFLHWEREIPSPTIEQSPPIEYWLQFYFIAMDNAGMQTQSAGYYDRVTFVSCYPPLR